MRLTYNFKSSLQRNNKKIYCHIPLMKILRVFFCILEKSVRKLILITIDLEVLRKSRGDTAPFQLTLRVPALRSIQTGRDLATRREFSIFKDIYNFNIFLCFSNSRNHLSNFSYLVCVSCKIFIRWRFYLFLKTENSRRVVESRSVCMDLKGLFVVK